MKCANRSLPRIVAGLLICSLCFINAGCGGGSGNGSGQPVTLQSVSVNVTSVVGGKSATGTATLSGAAPSGGITVSLSSNSAVAGVPPNIVVPAGSSSAQFNITTTVVTTNTSAMMTASYNGANQTASIIVQPPGTLSVTLQSVSVNPTSVLGGTSAAGTVTLSGAAPTGGITVSLSSNSAVAGVPPNILVPAGSSSAQFNITTTAVAINTSAMITAFYNGANQTASITAQAPTGGGSGSVSWQLLPDPFGTNYKKNIDAIAVNAQGVICVGGQSGVATSTDRGQTWTVINSGLPNAWVTALGFNSLGEPLAGVGLGLPPYSGISSYAYRYTGGTWQKATGLSAGLKISDFALDQTGAIIAVTGWAGDVWRSTDNGNSYTRVAAGIGAALGTPGALWVVRKAPTGDLYTGGEPGSGLFKSSDNGSTWTAVGLADPNYQDNIFAIGWNQNGEILAGRHSSTSVHDLNRFTGGQWAYSDSGIPNYGFFGSPNIIGLVLNGAGEVFAALNDDARGSYGGVVRSTDNGQTWTPIMTGLPLAPVGGIALDPAGYLYVICSHNATAGSSSSLFRTVAPP